MSGATSVDFHRPSDCFWYTADITPEVFSQSYVVSKEKWKVLLELLLQKVH